MPRCAGCFVQIVCVFDADQVAKEAFFVRTLQVSCSSKEDIQIATCTDQLVSRGAHRHLSCSRSPWPLSKPAWSCMCSCPQPPCTPQAAYDLENV